MCVYCVISIYSLIDCWILWNRFLFLLQILEDEVVEVSGLVDDVNPASKPGHRHANLRLMSRKNVVFFILSEVKMFYFLLRYLWSRAANLFCVFEDWPALRRLVMSVQKRRMTQSRTYSYGSWGWQNEQTNSRIRKGPVASSRYLGLCPASALIQWWTSHRTCPNILSSSHPVRQHWETSASCPASLPPPGL